MKLQRNVQFIGSADVVVFEQQHAGRRRWVRKIKRLPRTDRRGRNDLIRAARALNNGIPPPHAGQHTDDALVDWGVDAERVSVLRSSGAVA